MKTVYLTSIFLLSIFIAFKFIEPKEHLNERFIINGKFTPKEPKTLFIIGQDSETLSEYKRDVPEDGVEALTLYTRLESGDPSNTLDGILKPANWESGFVSFEKTLQEFPNSHLAIGIIHSNCGEINHTKLIANGEYDQSIKELASYLKGLTPRKIFLRFGFEFDGLWNCHEPETYKKAFRRTVKLFKGMNVSNVAFVWHSAVWPYPLDSDKKRIKIYDHMEEGHLERWYPGDDVVDWIGISAFYLDTSQWKVSPPDDPSKIHEIALKFARDKRKPVMIAEAAPQAYDIGKLTKSYNMLHEASDVESEGIWNNWYQLYFDFIDRNKDVIRAAAYINTNWKSQKMWQCPLNKGSGDPGCPMGYWGDSRVQANPYIKEKWLGNILNESRFVQSPQYEFSE